MKSELEQLIEEQAKDARTGCFQRPQSRCVPLGDFMLFIPDGSEDFQRYTRTNRQWVECPYHGRAFMREDSASSRYPYYCSRCRRDATYKWRNENRQHYNEVRRAGQRRWRAANPDKVAEQNARRRERYAAKKKEVST